MTVSTLDNTLDTMQLEVFFKVLDIIEKRHVLWFCERQGLNNEQIHDILANHIHIEEVENCVNFTFIKNSDLAENIKIECIKAYRMLFDTND